MNENTIKRSFTLLILMGITLFAAFQLVSGGSGIRTFGLMRALAIISPALLILFMKMRPVWIGLLIGLGASSGGEIPVPLFDVLPLHVIFGSIAFGILLLYHIMQRQRVWPLGPDSRFILATLCVALFWFAVQRPGSYRMGAGTAGLSRTVQMTASFLFFPVAAYTVAHGFDLKKNFRLILILGLVFYMRSIGQMATRLGVEPVFTQLSMMSFWILAPFLLAGLLFKAQKAFGWILLADLWVGYILLTGLLATHRSRILMGVGVVLICAWAFRRLKRYAVLMVLALIVSLPFFLSRGVPEKVKRAASMFLPASVVGYKEGTLESEMGWKSDFRIEMAARGWEKIKSSPFFGHGAAISVEEAWGVAYAASSAKDAYGRRQEFLEMGGSYHNMIMTLLVYYGVPAGLLCLFAIGRSAYKGIRLIRAESPCGEGGGWLTWHAAMMGSMWAYLVQFLVNGSQRDLRNMLVFCGVWYAVWALKEKAERDRLAAGHPASSAESAKLLFNTDLRA